MNACHPGHEGNKESIDCNVRQTATVDYHERSIIGGGPILLMGDSRYDRLCGKWRDEDFNVLFLDSTRHLLIHLCESWMNKKYH